MVFPCTYGCTKTFATALSRSIHEGHWCKNKDNFATTLFAKRKAELEEERERKRARLELEKQVRERADSVSNIILFIYIPNARA